MQAEKQGSFSLKKYSLKQWIAVNGYTQTFVAEKLGLDIVEFKRRLKQRELFTREQIFALIDLVGLRETYRIVYFPDRTMAKEDNGERNKKDQ